MTQQSYGMQQAPISMDGDYMYNPIHPLDVPGRAFTTMPPLTQHGGVAQANANLSSSAMARPNQGGAAVIPQRPGSNGNMAARGGGKHFSWRGR